MSDQFNPGDRVRVKSELAGGFTAPLRYWVKNGREAVVVSSWRLSAAHRAAVKVRFITKRKPKHPTDYEVIFYPDELERP